MVQNACLHCSAHTFNIVSVILSKLDTSTVLTVCKCIYSYIPFLDCVSSFEKQSHQISCFWGHLSHRLKGLKLIHR